MAAICRICHPEQFDEQDPDPQHIHVDDSEHPSETSDSDDSSDSSSDNTPEGEDNLVKAKVSDNDKEDKQFDNAGDEEDTGDATIHGVGKREIRRSHKSKKARRHRRGGRNKPKGQRAKARTLVIMPSGISYQIPNIVEPHWRCGQKTKLVFLRRNSKRGPSEFDTVEREMQNTIRPNDNCESTGGCFERYNIVKIEKIVQGCAWRRYQARKTDVALESGFANEKMLFHGTDAVWNVVSGGFDERFTSSNGQFGAGLYFAQHSSVANQFVFGYFGGNGCKLHHDKNCYICDRYLLLCRVTLGKPYQLKSIENMSHPPPGYNSVEALVGKAAFQAPEFVVYRGEQAYPEYLITYKIVKPKGDKHDDSDKNRNKNDGNSGFGNGNRNKNDGSSGFGNGNRNKNDGNSGFGNGNRNRNDGSGSHGNGKHKDDEVRTPSRHDVDADGGRRTDRRGYGNSYRKY